MSHIVTSVEGIPTSKNKQHHVPCSDCPWRRKALPGWLASMTVEEWIRVAHSELVVECHEVKGCQCAGLATFRTNVMKRPRSPDVLTLPVNTKTVFGSDAEFTEHHTKFKRRKK